MNYNIKKRLFLLFGLIHAAFLLSAKTSIDTTDNWRVLYNNKLIARFNEVDKNPPMSIKSGTIKPGDILTVDYFCDAPSLESKTGIYILDNKNHKITLAKGTGTFSPLKIALKDIKDTIKGYTRKYLDFYYFDERRNRFIFRLKVE